MEVAGSISSLGCDTFLGKMGKWYRRRTMGCGMGRWLVINWGGFGGYCIAGGMNLVGLDGDL